MEPTIHQTFNGLFQIIPGLNHVPIFWLDVLAKLSIAVLFSLLFLAALNMFLVWWERKIAGHIQSRLGPMEVGGWHGWAQSIADGVKLLSKEDIIPAQADKFLFILAPFIVVSSTMAMLAIIPISPFLQPVDLNIGILYITGIGSFSVIGILLAGWASNNKWSLYGSMRAAAQIVSYEIPAALAAITVVIAAGTLSFEGMIDAQSGGIGNIGHWFILKSLWLNWGGWLFSLSHLLGMPIPILAWLPPIPLPLFIPAFLIFYLASLAECNRTPFDLPEAESELVSGFHTEYSGIRFSFFFMAEYMHMFIVSSVATALFLGGWHGPFENHFVLFGVRLLPMVYFMLKVLFLIFIMIWIRWTVPRLRVDQLMNVCWKVFIPFALVNAVLVAIMVVVQ